MPPNYEGEQMTMLKSHLDWFFIIFSKEFRQTNMEAFEMFMFLAVAHFFGCYNPKQLADYLGAGHQGLYQCLGEFSLYSLRRMLVRFMVRQAAEELKPLLRKSPATFSRACVTMAGDNSVIDRLGRLLRCTWSWYSGRWKKVVNGQDLLGIVMTIGGVAYPLCLMFCSKQGRGNTDKPDLLISMLILLREEFGREGIDITMLPLTLDSWFVSDELGKRIRALGFSKLVIAGKGNYTFSVGNEKKKASEWKKTIRLESGGWGHAEVPFRRVSAYSPSFGLVVLFFFQNSASRTYYLMDFGEIPMRGAEAWRIWKQHHIIEFFWKILKSVLGIKSMRLQNDGLYAALLIKVIAYILAIRLGKEKPFSKMSVTQIMRKIRRELSLEDILREHFHLQISAT